MLCAMVRLRTPLAAIACCTLLFWMSTFVRFSASSMWMLLPHTTPALQGRSVTRCTTRSRATGPAPAWSTPTLQHRPTSVKAQRSEGNRFQAFVLTGGSRAA